MITPKHIPYKQCPVCAAPFESFSREMQSHESPTGGLVTYVRSHADGGRWETMRFGCGRVDKYSPNMHKIEVERKCSNDPAVLAEKKKREDALAATRRMVSSLDIDEVYRRDLLRKLSY